MRVVCLGDCGGVYFDQVLVVPRQAGEVDIAVGHRAEIGHTVVRYEATLAKGQFSGLLRSNDCAALVEYVHRHPVQARVDERAVIVTVGEVIVEDVMEGAGCLLREGHQVGVLRTGCPHRFCAGATRARVNPCGMHKLAHRRSARPRRRVASIFGAKSAVGIPGPLPAGNGMAGSGEHGDHVRYVRGSVAVGVRYDCLPAVKWRSTTAASGETGRV